MKKAAGSLLIGMLFCVSPLSASLIGHVHYSNAVARVASLKLRESARELLRTVGLKVQPNHEYWVAANSYVREAQQANIRAADAQSKIGNCHYNTYQETRTHTHESWRLKAIQQHFEKVANLTKEHNVALIENSPSDVYKLLIRAYLRRPFAQCVEDELKAVSK